MKFLSNIPIRRKLTVINMLTTSVVLLVAAGALCAIQLLTFRNTFTRDMSVIAEVIADNSATALIFDDRKGAEAILSALHTKPHVVSAWICRADGTEFARYGTKANASLNDPMPENGARFAGSFFLQGQPISVGGTWLGTLYIRTNHYTVLRRLIDFYLATLAGVLCVSFGLAYAISSRLQRLISDPIFKLVGTARHVAEKKDYSVRATKADNDELGLFTDTFNQMLEQIHEQDDALQQAKRTLQEQVTVLQREVEERNRAEAKSTQLHRQLIETSRRAGMAEVATGVLHNVGNVLNSVNVSVSLMQERLRVSRLPKLGQLAGMLDDHETNLTDFLVRDPKGRLIPAYVRQLADHFAEESCEALQQLDSIAKNLAHIKQIVVMQQTYARAEGVTEVLPPTALVEDALRINAAALDRHGVTVVRDYADVPDITVEKHKLLQILINLIRNANYALAESARLDKVIKLGLTRNGGGTIKFAVSDNGIGIKPENLARIFAHGFTTKREGHGFGLHSGAIAAKEMGGQLSAQSDGPGTGATFTIELPLHHQPVHS